ncbi:MAG TPA: hypothetical protein VNQ73_19225 [Ilumatobacter sp.]|nr:hypothetical protein [Ilumatobacter sp.]
MAPAPPPGQLATVVNLPVRATRATAGATLGTLRRLVADDVDDWGRDDAVVQRMWSLAALRWQAAVGGTEHVPRRAGALVVVNARRLALAPVLAALALGDATGRPVRFVGRPDIAPIGPAMQRLGGLLACADEITGALRARQLVVLGAEHTTSNGHCGRVDHRLIGAAVAAGVAVLPAAAISSPTGRAARVELGAPVRPARRRRGPLEELELAGAVQERIDELLSEAGATLSGTPLDWVAWVGGWARTAAAGAGQ